MDCREARRPDQARCFSFSAHTTQSSSRAGQMKRLTMSAAAAAAIGAGNPERHQRGRDRADGDGFAEVQGTQQLVALGQIALCAMVEHIHGG
jgi:hypothetical protein